MNIFCEAPCVVCPPVPEGLDGIFPNPNAEANPFSNFSSEAPDRVLFFGRNYRALPDDPFLGSHWTANGCIGLCFSSISQEDADLCAARQQVLCTSDDWPNTDVNPDPNGNPTVPSPRPTFLNDAQFCGFICPDGSPFYFTVIAGKFAAFSQLTANLIAYQYACNKAVANRICIGSLSRTSGCLDEPFSTQVPISSKGTSAPVSFDIVSGALPPGLSPSQSPSTAFFSGTPESVGEYMFTLRATDVGTGIFYMEKAFTIRVISVADEILPDVEQGEQYFHQLTTYGPAVGTFTWSLVSGTLPVGLTLSAAGVISGQPTTVGESTFTVGVANGGSTCTKELSLLVEPTSCLLNPSPTGCGEIGEPFSSTLMPSFEPVDGQPFVFSIVAGSLPPGLSLDGNTGVISGTPTTDGTFNYTVQLVNGPITCEKPFTCTITSTLCFDSAGFSWLSVNIPAGSTGSSAQSSMTGANGSFSLVCYSHDFADSSTAQQKHFFTTLTPPGGCRVKLKINYSYDLWENFDEPLPGARLRLQFFVNNHPVRTRDHLTVTGRETGTNLEWEEIFDVPEGSGRFEFRTFVRGANFSGCGITGCPSTANGTFTLEALPP